MKHLKINSPDIAARLMLVSVGFSLPGQTRKDKAVTREVLDNHNATEEAGAFNANLWPKAALAEVKSIQGACNRWLASQTFPFPAEGTAILPSSHYIEFLKELGEWFSRRDAAIGRSADRLQDWIDAARAARNGMFDISDYPKSRDEYIELFSKRCDFMPFPSSRTFSVLSIANEALSELASEAEKKAETIIQDSMAELWQRLIIPLRKMATTLAGESTKWHSTLLGNVGDIVNLIPALNIAGDTQLESFRSEVSKLLAGLKVETLKESPSLRSETARKVDDIVSRMSGFMS